MEVVTPLNDAMYAAQTASYTGTAGTTANTFPKGGHAVWVWCSTDAYVFVSAAGTAATTSNGIPIPGGIPVVLSVPRDALDGYKVSAIQVSAGGTLYAKPLQG